MTPGTALQFMPGQPALSQLGSYLRQARGKDLLEKKGPRGPSHSPTTV